AGVVDVINRLEGEYRGRRAVHRQIHILEGRAPDAGVNVVDAGLDVLQVQLGTQPLVDIPAQIEAHVLGDVLLKYIAVYVVALQAVDGRTVGAAPLVRPVTIRPADGAVLEDSRIGY